ncbi:MAG: radical SAM protein [Bacteroidetes bacterium 4572_117]|nr:MAG: radical SAM protein [Bacteroidetes bacterium 4572_117]
MATFLFDKIIFGPVKSRRLGISLGINLLPIESKLCNFNCIYCECGWTPGKKELKSDFHPRDIVKQKLEKVLSEMKAGNKALDVITYAGNGEPTMHPDFAEIIEDTILVRDKYFPKARIAVLSNATQIHKPKVVAALKKVDDNILKLDSAFPETVELLNKPQGFYRIENVVENMKQFEGEFTLQTMFVKGEYQGQTVDNTTDKEFVAWLGLVKAVNPKMIMIYTIARDTPSPDLVKVSYEELKQISDKLEKGGFKVQISA